MVVQGTDKSQISEEVEDEWEVSKPCRTGTAPYSLNKDNNKQDKQNSTKGVGWEKGEIGAEAGFGSFGPVEGHQEVKPGVQPLVKPTRAPKGVVHNFHALDHPTPPGRRAWDTVTMTHFS